MKDDLQKIAAYLELCHAALIAQTKAAHGWPNPLLLPEPENRHERKAVDLFTDELSALTRNEVPIQFRHRL